MKHLFIHLVIIGYALQGFTQAENQSMKLKWNKNLAEAYSISKVSNKPIFAFFTGSDWCGWCHKLQRDVFSKDDFIEWATENVILVELDFPRKKQLPVELAQQNNSLLQVFKVGGFPTIWIFDLSKDEVSKNFTISALGSLGYPQAAVVGSEQIKFIRDADMILAKRAK